MIVRQRAYLNRASSYQRVERRREKQKKKKNWNKKGGYGAPIIVPATPNSELASMLREVADQEPNRKQRFRIIERGGRTIEKSLMKPNSIGTDGCTKDDCPVCPGGGKQCHLCNVAYTIKCKPCQDSVYFGESHRNLYTRGKEHVGKLVRKDASSFMHRHQVEKHGGAPAEFEMRVVRGFKDPMSRQVTEAVMIKNHQGQLLNSKAEFYQPPLVRVRSEIVQGLED